MRQKCQSCSSCGMPLEKPEDHALGNIESNYCHYCVDDNGQLLPYDKVLDANINYYVESQGITKESATEMARELLATLPAWKKE